MVELKTEEITEQPLSLIAAYDPATCAILPRIMTYYILTVGRGSDT